MIAKQKKMKIKEKNDAGGKRELLTIFVNLGVRARVRVRFKVGVKVRVRVKFPLSVPLLCRHHHHCTSSDNTTLSHI